MMLLVQIPQTAFGAEVEYKLRDLNKGGATEVRLADYETKETEHFVIIYDTDGANTINESQLNELETVLENCWTLFIDKMGMEPTSTSVEAWGDKVTQYKTNVVIMGTGVDHYYLDAGQWGAYGSVDSAGYPYFMCSVTAITSPTVVAHEFGHAVHYAQGDNAWKDNIYLGPWFEAVANWFAEQYIYEYLDAAATQMSHLYLRANHLTKMNGRAYYEAWPFLQYLTEDCENTGIYGEKFVQKLLQYNSGNTNTLFWEVLEKVNGDLNVKDTVGEYASHMAVLDFENKSSYDAALDRLYNSVFYWQQRYTMLEALGEHTDTYAVPSEKAPQAMGYNIIPLTFSEDEVTVELNPLTDALGADWRARLVKEKADGATEYSPLFKAGEKMTMSVESTDELYISVAATPDIDKMVRHTITGWAEHSHESRIAYEDKTIYPYSVTIKGASPMERPRPSGMYKLHPNGGGRVAFTATVADTAYVGKNAVIMGRAKVLDNAVIDGYAIVGGNCEVSGNAYVGDYAVLFDRVKVSDNARVLENACLYVDYKVSGNAVVKGSSIGINSGEAKGEAVTYGDWFDDDAKIISGGSFSGYRPLVYDETWTGSKYAPLVIDKSYVRKYAENLRSRYEFDGDLRDTVSYSDLYNVGNVTTEDGSAVLGEGYIQLNESALCYDELCLILSVTGEGTLLEIGEKIKVEANGDLVTLTTDEKKLSAGGYDRSLFNRIEVVISNDKLVLTVGDERCEQSSDISAIEAMRGGESYLGRGFTGKIDYLRVYDKEPVEEKECEVFFEAPSDETGLLSTKGNDSQSAWYGWKSLNTNVTVDGGLNFAGSAAASVETRGYVTGKFVIEFTPEGGNTYPDHGILDLNSNVLFAHRYATDANSIHAGRGEINSAIRGGSSIKDTTGQDRLSNFVCEKLYGASSRSDRGSITWQDGEKIRITAENDIWDDSLASRFENSENKTSNMEKITEGDAVYVVRYSIAEDGVEYVASESVYLGHFEGFGGFKTAGGRDGVTVSYKDLVLSGNRVMYKSSTVSSISADGKEISVDVENGKEGSLIILALFDNDTLKEVQSVVYKGDTVLFETEAEYTNAKIMVWSGYDQMKAVSQVEILK